MKTELIAEDVKGVEGVKDVKGVGGGRTMTRGRALKKVGKVTLAAGVMMVLLNNPEKALASSGSGSGGDGGGLAKPPDGGDW